MKRKLLFQLLFFVLSGSVIALIGCGGTIEKSRFPEGALDNADIRKIDKTLHRLYIQKKFNGNILIGKEGKILYNKSFGIADYRTMKPLQSDSQFKLASVSKQFTAMAIMILKERGKLNYDDDIRTYLPEMPYEGITIRHLLTHTSGLPEHEKHWMKGEWPENADLPTNDDVIIWFTKYKNPLSFPPGSRFKYCNTGYAVLGSIIEKASGTTYDAFLKENIFTPLDMRHSIVLLPYKEQDLPNRVYGYKCFRCKTDFKMNDFSKFDGVVGHDGVYSTTEDLYKWDQALYTEKLVTESTLKEAFSRPVLANGSKTKYGFGWEISRDKPNKIVSHYGGWMGFRTAIERDVTQKIVIIILTNSTNGVVRKKIRSFSKTLSQPGV